MNRLKISCLVLLMITLGEAIYIESFKQTKTELPLPSPTPFINHAVDSNSLDMFNYWTKGVVNSIKTTAELQGTIVKIETNGKAEEHGWPAFVYALKIRFQAENGDGNDIFLTSDELKKTTFKKENGSVQEPMDYKQLKVGDKIKILMIFDLTKQFGKNFVSAEIIKVSE